MIYIPILIIIIILCIDLYFTFSIRFKYENETFEQKSSNDNDKDEDEIEFDIPNPWNKIQYFTHINKYYIKINKLENYIDKIMIWKSLPIIKNELIDIDIDNNYLILKTNSEEEALVVCNLILNHLNDYLTINDIVSKNLINYSINKAKRYKLIGIKLTELIKEGINNLNNNQLDTFYHKNSDDVQNSDDEQNSDDKIEKKKKKKKADLINKIKMIDNNSIKEIPSNNTNLTDVSLKASLFDRIEPYEGSEYASINFN